MTVNCSRVMCQQRGRARLRITTVLGSALRKSGQRCRTAACRVSSLGPTTAQPSPAQPSPGQVERGGRLRHITTLQFWAGPVVVLGLGWWPLCRMIGAEAALAPTVQPYLLSGLLEIKYFQIFL